LYPRAGITASPPPSAYAASNDRLEEESNDCATSEGAVSTARERRRNACLMKASRIWGDFVFPVLTIAIYRPNIWNVIEKDLSPALGHFG
jgi:hypothetical protein